MGPEKDITGDTTHFVPGKPAAATDGSEGKGQASLVVLDGWEIGREIQLEADEFVIGRSPLLVTPVCHPSISRQHARIEKIRDAGKEYYQIEDLGSRNGTLLNGHRAEVAQLKHGDQIQVGDVILKFVVHDTVELKFYRDVHRLIHHDRLTGMLTLEAFMAQVAQYLVEWGPKARFVLAMTDLDGLKGVNDAFGHPAGSSVVGKMGEIIRATLGEGDLAGLYGGDESVVLHVDADIACARARAEALRQAIEAHPFLYEENTIHLTISQGLAEYPRHGDSIDALVRAADEALYKAKEAGRNTVCTPDD